jgi:hypothetical protein
MGKHFHVERKKAAVAVYLMTKRLRTEHGVKWLIPYYMASVAAGGGSRAQVSRWVKTNIDELESDDDEETRGAPPVLSDDLENLLVGFAASSRTSLQPLTLDILRKFCISYLKFSPSLSTLSRIMTAHGFSSQKTMSRNSRMVSPDVVDDSLSFIEEICSYHFSPDRIICMDETGLWSNVVAPRTYHYKNW